MKDFPVTIDTEPREPEDVTDFRHKDEYPKEVQEIWDEIRAGRLEYLDTEGHIVEDIQKASVCIHPSYGMDALPEPISGIAPDELPPVSSTPIGEPTVPEETYAYKGPRLWIDPETEHLMVSTGDETVDLMDS